LTIKHQSHRHNAWLSRNGTTVAPTGREIAMGDKVRAQEPCFDGERELLLGIARGLRGDRDAWQEAAQTLAAVYARVMGVDISPDHSFDLKTIRLLLAGEEESPPLPIAVPSRLARTH
jgi:hypothetical protein